MKIYGIKILGPHPIPCIVIQHKKNASTVVYLHENGLDMFLSIRHACDISNILKSNVIILEYPSFGIYDHTLSEDSTEPVTPDLSKGKKSSAHNSMPISIAGSRNLQRSVNSEGIVKQIYSDLKSVFKFLDDQEEIVNKRVFLYGKGMGAHFALYAATEMKIKLGGVILHNCASLPKKKKLSKETWRHLAAYLPQGNLERAARIEVPTMILHTARDEDLVADHAFRLRQKIPKAYVRSSIIQGDSERENERDTMVSGSRRLTVDICCSDKGVKISRACIIEKLKDFMKYCENV